MYDIFPTAQGSPKDTSSESSDNKGDEPMDHDYLSDNELVALLRDDSSSSPTASSPNAVTLVAAVSEKEAAPTASHDEEPFVAPETQTVELNPVKDIPKPDEIDDASWTTPQSESGGQEMTKWQMILTLGRIKSIFRTSVTPLCGAKLCDSSRGTSTCFPESLEQYTQLRTTSS